MKPFNVFPYDSNIDFMRMRWVSLSVAFLLMVVALGAMGARGFNFSLDFTGGVGVELRYAKAPDVDKVRQQLDAAGALYAASGFISIEPYNDNANATRWYSKVL